MNPTAGASAPVDNQSIPENVKPFVSDQVVDENTRNIHFRVEEVFGQLDSARTTDPKYLVHANEDCLTSDTTEKRYYLVTVRKDRAALEGLVELQLPDPEQSCNIDSLLLVAHKLCAT